MLQPLSTSGICCTPAYYCFPHSFSDQRASIRLLLMELLLYSSSLLLLLLSSHGLHSTEGRGLHYQLKEPADPKVQAEKGAPTAMSAAMIGSRPPRCEGRCAPCGRCEAVQVPVAPRVKGANAGGHFRLSRAFGDRVDESSTNYKPLNWKCRCADRRFLNP